jgi:hypothetical protein
MPAERSRNGATAPVLTFDPFIVNDAAGKPDAAARKLIRSHVMRGKNRTKPLGISVNTGSWIKCSESHEHDRSRLSSLSRQFSGTGLSLIKFPDETQPYMLDLAFKCKQYNIQSAP